METNRFVETLPEITGAMGTARFEKQLADAIGTVLDYDFITMARYSAFDQPRFLIHSHSFPSHLAELYLSEFIEDDPYLEHWRESEKPGVIWLQDMIAGHNRCDNYVQNFLPQIRVKDEIGVFMPAVARDSVAFFYNNRRGLFTPEDVLNLRGIFPAAASLYRLHIRLLMSGEQPDIESSPSLGRPMRLTSVTGETIWVTNEWREQKSPFGHMIRTSIAGEFGGTERYVWTPAPQRAGAPGRSTSIEAWGNQLGLTPRERDIVGLTLEGHNSSGIAGALGLSVGNIKNHKRRIYNKLDITSERELFLLYIEAMSLGQPSAS